MRASLFLGMLVLSACQVTGTGGDPPAKKYACNEAYYCPQGQNCINDCCGGPPCSSDYYEAVPSDQPPPPPTLGPAEGCKSGTGYTLIEGKAYACPCVFVDGAKKQCATGLPGGDYLHCTTSRGFAQYSEVLERFFAAGQPMEQGGEGAQCGWSTPDNNLRHYVAGLGGGNLSYIDPVGNCAGWKTLVQVDAVPSNGWSVKLSHPPIETDMNTLSNANPEDGVICCRGIF